MNTKSSRPDYGDLHRLWEDVIRLRLRVSSLEEAQIKKRLGGHFGLHLPASLKTNANGCSKRNAGAARDARQRPHIAPRIPPRA